MMDIILKELIHKLMLFLTTLNTLHVVFVYAYALNETRSIFNKYYGKIFVIYFPIIFVNSL